jgi:hypothetical protein
MTTTSRLEMRTDPRSDPRMLAALAPFGPDAPAAPPPIDGHAPRAAHLELAAAGEAGFEAVFAALIDGLLEVDVEHVRGFATRARITSLWPPYPRTTYQRSGSAAFQSSAQPFGGPASSSPGSSQSNSSA